MMKYVLAILILFICSCQTSETEVDGLDPEVANIRGRQLACSLLNKTADGEIDWETSVDAGFVGDHLLVSFSTYTVSYRFGLFKSTLFVGERFSLRDIAKISSDCQEQLYGLLFEKYGEDTIKAYQSETDKVFDDIEKSLKNTD